MIRAKLLLILIPVLGVQLLLAAIPQTISYQGVLWNPSTDAPYDGNYDLTFRLYDASSGGTQWWSETQVGVLVDNGIFNVILGSTNTFISTDPKTKFEIPYWLEIAVGPTTLAPRIELTSVPYANQSRGVMGYRNVFPSSGFVGIGTTAPIGKLHIQSSNADGIFLTDSLTGDSRASLVNLDANGGSLFLNDAGGATQARIRGYASPGGVQAYFTAGNVGIGTATPVDALEVVGTVSADFFAGDGSALTGLGIAPGAVGTTELANGAVTGSKIATGVIDGTHISTAADLQVSNLGVGIAPARPLDVKGTTTGDYVASITNSALGANAGNGLLVSVADTTIGGGGTILSIEGQGNSYLTVTDRGKVGIGTTTPSYQLHVRDTTANWNYLAYFDDQPTSSTAYGIYSSANAYNAGTNWAYGGQISATGGYSGGGAFGLQVSASSYGGSYARGINITTGGSGTGARYAIYATASGGTGSKYAFYGAGGDFYLNGNTGLGGPPSSTYRLYVNGNSYFTGNLGVGSYNASYRLYVNGNSYLLGNLGVGTYNASYKLYVGGAGFATGGFISPSDRRWKRNIAPLEGSLSKVLKLRGVTYEWRTNEFEDMNFSEGAQIGVIAQEMEEVLPELVNTDEDGYKAVAYDKLTAVLIEAVKELNAEKIALQQQVTAQQGEITQLQQQMARVEALLESADLASRD